MDDGYWDQAEVGGTVFSEFDCPVTTFTTTGFLDGTLWFWWDRIDCIFRRTRRTALDVAVGDISWRAEWAADDGRRCAQEQFIAACKTVRNAEKLAAIESLADRAEVAVPKVAPREYAPLQWRDLPRYEKKGMTFGPHTVTHPVLSRVDDSQCKWEISESWRALLDHAARPVPVFCFPNGKPADFGSRETSLLKETGLRGAVTGVPGYVAARTAADRRDSLYFAPRFAYEGHHLLVLQSASGLERLKELFRREAPR